MRLRVGERIIHLQEELRKAALSDYLTGLPNRRSVIASLEAEIARAERTKEPFSVALLDIDHFKSINDTYGHVTGDDVLAEVARRMRSAVRIYDVVGRYGGEEFLLIFPGLVGEDSLQICERVRSIVENRPFYPVRERGNGAPFTVTASIGTCEWDSSFAKPDEILIKVDQALYNAKEAGRNLVRKL